MYNNSTRALLPTRTALKNEIIDLFAQLMSFVFINSNDYTIAVSFISENAAKASVLYSVPNIFFGETIANGDDGSTIPLWSIYYDLPDSYEELTIDRDIFKRMLTDRIDHPAKSPPAC